MFNDMCPFHTYIYSLSFFQASLLNVFCFMDEAHMIMNYARLGENRIF